MEKKLKQLFDYQKFNRNTRLDAMLSDAEERYSGSLSDEELEFVSAAGEANPVKPLVWEEPDDD